VNPFVFLVGSPRSGTTLLHRLVDAHPEVALVYETLWILKFYERRLGLTPEGNVTSALPSRLLEHRRFGQLGFGADDLNGLLEANADTPYADFVIALFDRYGEGRGKRLVGDKSPGYVRSIPTLHRLWPRARFVHLIRDGRDVCLSAVNWKMADRVFRDHGTWPHLGLDFDDAMLRFHKGRTRATPGLSSKRKWLPPAVGLRDWRTEMAEEDVMRFEAAAGELLDELGYERGVSRRDSGLVAHTGSIRRRFIEDVSTRGRPLPEGWA